MFYAHATRKSVGQLLCLSLTLALWTSSLSSPAAAAKFSAPPAGTAKHTAASRAHKRTTSTPMTAPTAAKLAPPTRAQVRAAYGQLPLQFAANRGQMDAQVKFLARGQGYNLFLTATEAVLTFTKPPRQSDVTMHRHETVATTATSALRARAASPVLRMKLAGAATDPQIEGAAELPGKLNYFIGNDPTQWRTNVPTYAQVRYRDVYPGVDVVYYGRQRELEYDLIVAPGVDPDVVKLAFDGAQQLRLDARGDLLIATNANEVRLHKPTIYQETVGGVRQEIAGRYVLQPKQQSKVAKQKPPAVGFEIAAYDRTRPLVIDPVFTLAYSTYLGGANAEIGQRIAVDADGNAYVTGFTDSLNFPTANPLQPNNGGPRDAFVTKLNPAGTALVYSSYLGGNGDDVGYALALDGARNVYLAGATSSTNFPLANPLQATVGGGASDAFVAKLNADGDALIYSTYLGGSNADYGSGLAIDTTGAAYVSGVTFSTNFPTANALQPANAGLSDAFVAKLNPTGSALVYSTYLGGSGAESQFFRFNSPHPVRIGVDGAGRAFVAGHTRSGNFPVVNAFQPNNSNTNSQTVFVSGLSADGASFIYSTYLGGDRDDVAYDIKVDAVGNAFVVGETFSCDFPTTAGAFQTFPDPNCLAGSNSVVTAFVSKIAPPSASGLPASLAASTFLGTRSIATAVALDGDGNIFVSGATSSDRFPLVSPLQARNAGAAFTFDTFITQFNPTLSALGFSTYLGGTGDDYSLGLAVTPVGDVYSTGFTQADYPTAGSPPFQPASGGGVDAFVSKIAFTAPSFAVNSIRADHGGDTGIASVTIYGTNITPGATARLTRTGQLDIEGGTTNVSAFRTMLTTFFDLRQQQRGLWNVVVTNPDGSIVTLPDAFTIEEGRAAQVYVDIIARSAIRTNREVRCAFVVGNMGNVDALAVPVDIAGLPANAIFTPDYTFLPPQPVDPNVPPVDYSQIPKFYETADGRHNYPMIIPRVPAGQTLTFAFRLTIPTEQEFDLEVFAEPALATLTPAPAGGFRPGKTRGKRPSIASQITLTDIVVSPDGKAKLKALIEFTIDLIGVVLPVDCAQALDEAIAKGILNVTNGAAMATATEVLNSTLDLELDLAQAVLLCAFKSTVIGKIFQGLRLGYKAGQIIDMCIKLAAKVKKIRAGNSFDPNDKVGSPGVGEARYVAGTERARYTIFFENQATATLPAQEVVITDQLDAVKFDLSTFSFDTVAFGTHIITPDGINQFTQDVDLRPANDLIARVSAQLDLNTGLITWRFQSIDPATGQPTEDPTAGFLPPDTNPPAGDGLVAFTVQPRAELVTGDLLQNQARIVFDTNPPIDTPVRFNTIDKTPPVSQVAPLAAVQAAPNFNVSWAGTDQETGIQNYTIYVADNGAPFTAWLVGTQNTAAVFMGQPNHDYAFYSVAQDGADNYEAAPDTPDASTHVAAADLALDLFATTVPIDQGDQITYTINVNNNGSDAATGVTVTDVLPPGTTFVSATAGCALNNNTVTCALGTLNNGAGAQVMITLSPHVPGTLTNAASVSALTGDPDATNNTDTQTSTINGFITGRVMLPSGAPLANVTLTATGSQNLTTQTASDGSYAFANVTRGDSYTITPSKPGYTFSPPSITIDNVISPQTADFTATPNVVAVLPAPGDVIISEFRVRGPNGTTDEFVELYNTTNNDINVNTPDGSAGWPLAALAADGVTITTPFTIPIDTIIPAHGHYLAVNSAGYSLSARASADQTYTADLADNTGLALFDTADPAHFDLAERLDAAGFNVGSTAARTPLVKLSARSSKWRALNRASAYAKLGVTPPDLFREGAGLTPLQTSAGEYSVVRKMTSGVPQDTGDNAADFVFIATSDFGGRNNTALSVLGAPGPENTNSPVQRNATIKASLIDPQAPATAAPNRVRDLTPVARGQFGTLAIRRRFTNQTGAPVTSLRFRVVDITTLNTPNPGGAQADLRALSSNDVVVTISGNQSLTVRGTTLGQPPVQTFGGGLNSTLAVGPITLSSPLAPGASVPVQFLLGVQSSGSFRFFINVEAAPAAAPALLRPKQPRKAPSQSGPVWPRKL